LVKTVLAVAAINFIAGRLGLLLAIPPGYATAIWAPSGIALAAVLLFGSWIWPGIWLGSFGINILTLFDPGSVAALVKSVALAGAIGAGSSLQAVAGSLLIRRFVGFPHPLDNERDVLKLLALGGPVSCLIAATVGVTALWVGGVVLGRAYLFNWWTWWIGDALGVFIFTPLMLIWNEEPRPVWGRRGIIVVLLAMAFALTVTVFVRPLAEGAEDLRRVIVWAVAVPAFAFMVGAQRRRLAHLGELRYRDLFHNIPVALYHSTPDGRFLAVNPAFSKLLGRPDPTPFGTLNAADLYIDPDDRRRWVATIEREGSVRDYESRMRRGDGTVIWVRETARAIRDAAGRTLYFDGSLEDITRQRDAAEQIRKLSAATDQSPAIVVITDTEERIEYVNPRFTEVTGYAPAEVLGSPAPRLAEPLPLEWQRELRETIEAGRTWHGEFRAFKKNGDHYWERASVSSLRRPDGTITHFIKVAEDVTEQKARLEIQWEMARRFRALIEHSSDTVSLISAEGKLLYVSPAVERILGYPFQERVGRDAFELLHPEELERARALYADLLTHPGKTVSGQFRYRRQDGSWRWLEVTATNLLDEPSVRAVVANYRDITERRLIEQEIRQLNVQLEQRVIERTAELRDAKEESERANRAKSDFLSRMSHELRTPLNAILGFAQLLEMEPLPEEQRDSVRQILKGGQHLLHLVNEVLDITRIEAGNTALSLEPVGLAAIVEESIDLIMPLAAQRQIQVVNVTPEAWDRHVHADSQRLKQVLLNLLSNAVKYNRDRGKVQLSCEDRPNGRVRIGVADTGVGIPHDRLARLFIPFERLGADQIGVEGTGLGLAHSRALVESMGAEIGVETEPGRGSLFWVDLLPAEEPSLRRDMDGAPLAVTPVRPHQTRTVLYIDNNPSNHTLMERFLAQRPDVRLVAAMQGRLGLDLARQHDPALILLDLHLDDVSGEEVLRRLQSDPATARVPVVVLSADTTPGQADRLLALGARDFLAKPLDLKRLLATLAEALAERSGVRP
jgi:PAS domain S-box-containing protein